MARLGEHPLLAAILRWLAALLLLTCRRMEAVAPCGRRRDGVVAGLDRSPAHRG
uniref:Uncharacterized protein n=1 Tax=Arundo donax TaxID=35708 RepID=A0A0A8Z009_ARUDO